MPCRGVLGLALVLSVAMPAEALEIVRLVQDTDCELKAEWNASSDSLYKLAYDWSHTHDIRRWRFSPQAGNCSKVVYSTRIHVPSVFLNLWKRQSIVVGIDKSVCVRGLLLRETLIVSDIPFIDDIVMHVEASVSKEKSSLSAEYSVSMPWYMAMVETQVHAHLRTSVLEYLEILKRHACT